MAKARTRTHSAIEKLGYLQIDTISVVERAHHHTLWNRVADYQVTSLNKLLEQAKVFEYWSHAAAYLPMRDFRYSLPRKRHIQKREQGYWCFQDQKLMDQVLERIRHEGPLQARDFEYKPLAKTKGWPEKKPAKKALDQLFMEGDLMICRRDGFQKVYDLSERVLTADVDTRYPSDAEYHKHLIINYLSANGIGNAANMGYLLKSLKPALQKACAQLHEDGQLISLVVGGQSLYALPTVDELLAKRVSRTKVKILSPFDNLLIQRQRTRDLFGFDYQIECYVTAAKRQYGYFCLPLLWGDRFAGRMDAKVDRKTGVLHVLSLHLEAHIASNASLKREFEQALQSALKTFMHFNQAHTVRLP